MTLGRFVNWPPGCAPYSTVVSAVEPTKVLSFHRDSCVRISPRKTRDFPQDSFTPTRLTLRHAAPDTFMGGERGETNDYEETNQNIYIHIEPALRSSTVVGRSSRSRSLARHPSRSATGT